MTSTRSGDRCHGEILKEKLNFFDLWYNEMNSAGQHEAH